MSLREVLRTSGTSRRDFLQYCTAISATLALPQTFAPQIAEALENEDTRPSVIWMEFQSSSGDSEAILRSGRPKIGDLLLDVISLGYNEVVMAASGDLAEEA